MKYDIIFDYPNHRISHVCHLKLKIYFFRTLKEALQPASTGASEPLQECNVVGDPVPTSFGQATRILEEKNWFFKLLYLYFEVLETCNFRDPIKKTKFGLWLDLALVLACRLAKVLACRLAHVLACNLAHVLAYRFAYVLACSLAHVLA